MSKKIMKTITLIVFLVIIGFYSTDRVSAAIKYTDCYYDFNFEGYKGLRSTGRVKVRIKLSSQNPKIDMEYSYPAQYGTKTYDGKVKNYQSGSTPFSGYDYYIKDGKAQCPPYIYYLAYDQKGASSVIVWDEHDTYIYFHDGSNLNTIKANAQDDASHLCGNHVDTVLGVEYGYYTDCVNMSLTETIHEEEPDEPEPEPEKTECELNPEACDDPEINSDVVKPISPDSTATYSCGDEMMTGLTHSILKVTSYAYNILRIIVPLALIILGSIDLVKGIMAQKEDEIRKGQQIFIKRLITAILIFFVFAIVKFLLGIFASGNSADIVECLNCIIDGPNSSSCVKER